MMWIWICLALLFVIELCIINNICNIEERLLNDEKHLLNATKAFRLAIALTKIDDDLTSFEIDADSFAGVNEETFYKLRTIVDEAFHGKKTWKDVTNFAYMHGIKLIIETKKTEDK